MNLRQIYNTLQRQRTLHTDYIYAMPIVILMPHSACNCKCIMCDIWKDNKNLKQLTIQDVAGLLSTLSKLHTQQVVMSGGEALLNSNFFELCKMLRTRDISITLLTSGLLIRKHAHQIAEFVDELTVSLDGDEHLHDAIRNVVGGFKKITEGLAFIRSIKPNMKITARTVIHQLNFHRWPEIIKAARAMGTSKISFLPADVSSHAFNRQMAWNTPQQDAILIPEKDLPELSAIINKVVLTARRYPGLIAESNEKLYDIYRYYAAFYGHNPFPFKKCNAPWVSTVVEADGSVRPCFFHDTIGTIKENSLGNILNSKEAIAFRKSLKQHTNEVCARCVCSLNLPPTMHLN